MYQAYIISQKKLHHLGGYQTLLGALKAVGSLHGNLKDPSGSFTININLELSLEGELHSNGITLTKLRERGESLDLCTPKIYKSR